MSVQMSQITMSQVEEEQKGHKKESSAIVQWGQCNQCKHGDRSRSRSEKRKVNKKGAEMEEEYVTVGSLTYKICQCVFCDEDDKLIECGRCEKWECINCSNMSEKQYDLLNDKSLEVRLHWLFNECNALATSAVKTDKELEEICIQYVHTEEIQETRTVLDQRITSEVSRGHQKVEERHDKKLGPETARGDREYKKEYEGA